MRSIQGLLSGFDRVITGGNEIEGYLLVEPFLKIWVDHVFDCSFEIEIGFPFSLWVCNKMKPMTSQINAEQERPESER